MTFPIPPAPRTWSELDTVTVPRLRNDPGNLAALLVKRPLLIAAQLTTAQGITSGTITPVVFDSENVDNWNGHGLGQAPYSAKFPGWYLAEGTLFYNDVSVSGYYAAGIKAVENSVTTELFGNLLCGNGTANATGPSCADLVQLNPGTSDEVALFAYETASGVVDLASAGAYFTCQWAGLPTSAFFPNYQGTVVASPQPAALWPPGSGTLITNSGGIAAGAVSMTVASNTGMVVGGVLGLDYYEGSPVSPMAESVTISSVSGTTIGISATSYPHGGTATDGYVAVPVSAAFMNQQVRDVINFLAFPPMARLKSTTSQALSGQTFPAATAITFGSATLDNFSGWSAGSPTKWTVPVSGVYYVYGQVLVQSVSTNLSAGVAVSGGTIQWGDSHRSQTALQLGVTVRKHLRLTAGQYLEIYACTDSTGVSTENASNMYCTMLALWRGF